MRKGHTHSFPREYGTFDISHSVNKISGARGRYTVVKYGTKRYQLLETLRSSKFQTSAQTQRIS